MAEIRDMLENMDTIDKLYILVTIASTILWIIKIARKY